MPYDTDIFTGCEGLFYCLATWSNEVTEGYFWSIIMIAFGIVLFMGTIGLGLRRAFGYASFATGIIGLTLVQLSLIPLWFFSLTLVVSLVGIAVMLIGER